MPKLLQKTGVAAASLILIAFSSPLAFAEDSQGSATNTDRTSINVHTDSNDVQESVTTHQSATSGETNTSTTEINDNDTNANNNRLSGTHLKTCQQRQANINKILNRIVTRSQNQLNLFNQIATKVEAFKSSKNLTVTNYDQLVATLTTDKTTATTDLTTLQAADSIDCSGSDPKGAVDSFKTNLQTEINDLKTYKTDLKSLISAVKTAAGDISSDNKSGDNQ